MNYPLTITVSLGQDHLYDRPMAECSGISLKTFNILIVIQFCETNAADMTHFSIYLFIDLSLKSAFVDLLPCPLDLSQLYLLFHHI